MADKAVKSPDIYIGGPRRLANKAGVTPTWDKDAKTTPMRLPKGVEARAGNYDAKTSGARMNIDNAPLQNPIIPGPIRSFQDGTDYVESTGPAILHQGEAVVPAKNNPAAIDLSAGLVPKTGTNVPNKGTGGIDLSAGLIPKSGSVQTPPAASQPPVESAGARFLHSAMPGSEQSNQQVKERLKQIASHPVDTALQFGKGILDAQSELAYRAKEDVKNGDYVSAAAHALHYLMPGIGPALAKSSDQLSKGDIAGGAGTLVGQVGVPIAAGGLVPESAVPSTGFKAVQEAGAREAAAATPKTASAEETAPKGLPLKEAGQRVQQEAQAVRDVKGKAVGQAKEAVAGKLPAKPASPLPKGSLPTAAQKVLDDIESTQQLAGAKDPDIADVEAMARHLVQGKNAAGEPLSADPMQADAINRAFNVKIDQLQAKADAGGNATALRQVKNLKSAYQDDLYDAYETHGDPAAAQALRNASKEYAKTVDEQTSGPAKAMFRNKSPEKIVSNIVSGGAKAQSAVESLMKNSSPEGQQVLRDSVLKELYRKNTLPDGTLDAVKARKQFYGMGDTAKTLFGNNLKQTSDYLDAAAKEQTAREAAASKPSVGARIGSRVSRLAGAGTGAAVGGPIGAIVGDVAAGTASDAVFNQGASGAVKIGISPTEKIVLSPTEASTKLPAITKFLRAKAVGNVAGMTSAYQALAGKPAGNVLLNKALDAAGVPKNDDPYQRIISFRALKNLPDDVRASAQKAITNFNNALVTPK